MLYNRKKYRKVNDHKLLRKVGKRWVTVSVILLGMLAGGGLVASANVPQPQSVVQANSSQQVNSNHNNSANSNQVTDSDVQNFVSQTVNAFKDPVWRKAHEAQYQDIMTHLTPADQDRMGDPQVRNADNGVGVKRILNDLVNVTQGHPQIHNLMGRLNQNNQPTNVALVTGNAFWTITGSHHQWVANLAQHLGQAETDANDQNQLINDLNTLDQDFKSDDFQSIYNNWKNGVTGYFPISDPKYYYQFYSTKLNLIKYFFPALSKQVGLDYTILPTVTPDQITRGIETELQELRSSSTADQNSGRSDDSRQSSSASHSSANSADSSGTGSTSVNSSSQSNVQPSSSSVSSSNPSSAKHSAISSASVSSSDVPSQSSSSAPQSISSESSSSASTKNSSADSVSAGSNSTTSQNSSATSRSVSSVSSRPSSTRNSATSSISVNSGSAASQKSNTTQSTSSSVSSTSTDSSDNLASLAAANSSNDYYPANSGSSVTPASQSYIVPRSTSSVSYSNFNYDSSSNGSFPTFENHESLNSQPIHNYDWTPVTFGNDLIPQSSSVQPTSTSLRSSSASQLKSQTDSKASPTTKDRVSAIRVQPDLKRLKHVKFINVIRSLWLHKKANFTRHDHLAAIHRRSGTFRVLKTAMDHHHRLRYYINYHGKRGYVTARSTFVNNAYYYSKRRNFRARVLQNTYLYRTKQFTKHHRRALIHRGAKLRVKQIVRYGKITRCEVNRGYVSANRDWLKIM